MNHKAKWFAAIAILLAAISLKITNVFGEGPAPLADRRDAVIIAGKQLPAPALGAKIDIYRVYASKAGALAAIPFQIDEFDKSNLPLMKSGPKIIADADNGAFDANDELVFMARDMGAQTSGPTVTGCQSPVEIIATDAKTGAKGFAYLFRCATPPPLSKVRYVKWDPTKRTIMTDLYKLGWQQKLTYYYDYVSVNNGPDILDRLKVRVTVGLGGLRKTYSEDNFIPTFFGVNDGPVRIVYRCDNKLDLGPLAKLPVGQNLYFYDTWALFSSPLDARFNPAVLGLDFRVGIELDMSLQRSKGYKLCADVAPECMAIDGQMNDAEKQLTKNELHWGGVIGSEGGTIIRFIMDPKLPTKSMGVYVDNDAVKDTPEYVPGSGPVIGFDVVDWKKAKAGIYNLDFYQYFMKQYTQAEIKNFDRIVYEKLKIEAK